MTSSNTTTAPLFPLDFSPHAQTPEAELKRLTLSYTVGNLIYFVDKQDSLKSAVLSSLVRDQHVRQKFPQNCYLVRCPQTSSPRYLLSSICQGINLDVCKHSKVYKLIAKGYVKEACQVLAQVFEQSWLIILDNVCTELRDIVNDIVKRWSGKAVLIISCEKTIAPVDSIRVERVNWEKGCRNLVALTDDDVGHFEKQQQRIMLKYAHINPESIRDTYPLNRIVHSFSENWLSLELLGGALKTTYAHCDDVQSALTECWKYIRAMKTDYTQSDRKYFAAFKVAVAVMRKYWPEELELHAEEAVMSLAVFRENEISIRALESVWGQEKTRVEEIVELLCGAYLIERSDSGGITVWENVKEAAQCLMKKNYTDTFWHEQFVKGMGSVQEWIEEKDEYCVRNLVYHLLGAGRIEDAIQLVLDYRWTKRGISANDATPLQHGVNDVRQVYHYLKREAARLKVDGGTEAVVADFSFLHRVLCAANWSSVAHTQECAFQLYARLCGVQGKTSVLEHFVRSLEKHADRPWLKAVDGLLQQPDSSLIFARNWVGDVQYAVARSGVVVIIEPESRKTLLMDFVDGDVRMRTKVNNWMSQFQVLCSSAEECFLFTMPATQSSSAEANVLIETVTTDGDLQRVGSFAYEIQEFEKVTCCCRVGDAEDQFVLGSSSGRIRLYDGKVKDWGDAGKYGSRYELTWEGLCESAVKSLVTTKDGKLMFIVCEDGGLRRMTVETKEMSNVAEQTRLIVLSKSEKFVAIAAENGLLRLIDVEKNDLIREWEAQAVDISCMLFSNDEKYLFCGREDGMIQIWSVNSGTLLRKEKRYHATAIQSLIQMPGGQELFSLSKNRGCVTRIFVDNEGEYLRETGEGFRTQAFCLSQSGKLVVTAETDMICVRDWRSPRTAFDAVRRGGMEELRVESIDVNIGERYKFESVEMSIDEEYVAFSVGLGEGGGKGLYLLRIEDRRILRLAVSAARLESDGNVSICNISWFKFIPEGSLISATIVIKQESTGTEQEQAKQQYDVTWDMFGTVVACEKKSSEPNSENTNTAAWSLEPVVEVRNRRELWFNSTRLGWLDIDCALAPQKEDGCYAYDAESKRLWLLDEFEQLHFVDLIDCVGGVQEEEGLLLLRQLPRVQSS